MAIDTKTALTQLFGQGVAQASTMKIGSVEAVVFANVPAHHILNSATNSSLNAFAGTDTVSISVNQQTTPVKDDKLETFLVGLKGESAVTITHYKKADDGSAEETGTTELEGAEYVPNTKQQYGSFEIRYKNGSQNVDGHAVELKPAYAATAA